MYLVYIRLVFSCWVTISNVTDVTGLGPRKFRSTYAELGDQSVWTDTPAEKARKAAAAREREKVE